MKTETLFISFCTQKGGVGKSTMTILAADWLHFYTDLNVLVVDCDYPQHSIDELRGRERKALLENDEYKIAIQQQFKKYHRKAYPVLRCRPSTAIEEVKAFIETNDVHFDIVIFDLPGTLNTSGVIYIISQLDYLFVPMRSDRLVMQSTINFARTINERFVSNPAANTKGIYLFWNMVDRRERPDLYAPFEKLLVALDLKLMSSRILMRSKFSKEFTDTKGEAFRSTIFVPNKAFLIESGFASLMSEISEILNI